MQTTVQVNPLYTTNNYDAHTAGWYVTSPNNSNLALRVQNTNLNIDGEIRLYNNSSLSGPTGPSVFQGYDGASWLNFNALTGPTGPAGLSFNNLVEFINTISFGGSSYNVTFGNIFITNIIDPAQGMSTVYARSLCAGDVPIASGDIIPSMQIMQNSEIITLISKPIPYQWDFSTDAMITKYKSGSSDSVFKASGDVSKWLVKTGYNIVKGTAVRIVNNGSGNSTSITIIPMLYSSTTHINPFANPANVIGIALENASGGNSCLVCTKGVTTVLCTSNTSLDFVPTSSLSVVGLPGLVGCDGGIFCNSMKPVDEYIRAGFFLESDSDSLSIAGSGQYVLFNVDIQLSSG